ncbi:MAG: efflux RND transporter periplasmic adaptor subunit [Myxococcales bacterium]
MKRLQTLKTLPLMAALCAAPLLHGCSKTEAEEKHEEQQRRIVVTTPIVKDVVTTQQFVCQIHSRAHIEIRALERGYLEEINVKEGQSVKKNEVMFKIVPVLYQATLDTEMAEAELAQIRFNNTQNLTNQAIVSKQELAMANAELARAHAKVKRAQAELNFTAIKAPFDGMVDRQHEQKGSLVEEGDILSTLSDNQLMWVYFNVPEAQYLEYKSQLNKGDDSLEVELQLANGQIFPYPGKIGAIEADFNNETGNIAFRADFPNPEGLLRHGQTGTILLHRKVKNAIVIPQRATYEILAKQYVYVIEQGAASDGKPNTGHETPAPKGEGHEASADHGAKHAAAPEGAQGHGVVRQREIVVQEEMEDIYVIKKGLEANDKIIFEGVREAKDGDHVAYEVQSPSEILSHLKFHAE